MDSNIPECAQFQTVIVFTGLGAHYQNMGRELFDRNELFFQLMRGAFEKVATTTGLMIEQELYPSTTRATNSFPPSTSFEILQYIQFILQHSLFELLKRLGITPTVITGYSFGEYPAACCAGVISFEDVIELIKIRSSFLSGSRKGLMLSIPLSSEHAERCMEGYDVAISIDNGDSVLVAGFEEEIGRLENDLMKKGVITIPVPTIYPLHSRFIDVDEIQFDEAAKKLRFSELATLFKGYVRNDDGSLSGSVDHKYFYKHLTRTIYFDEGIRHILQKRPSLCIEVGPGRDLSVLMSKYKAQGYQVDAFNTIRPLAQKRSDVDHLKQKMKVLQQKGFNVQDVL